MHVVLAKLVHFSFIKNANPS